MILSEEQEAAVQYRLRPESLNACLDSSSLGVGKTIGSIEFARRVNAKVVLIIAPLQTIGKPGEGGWWGTWYTQDPTVNFRQIDSSVKGKAAHADYQWSVPGAYIVGHQQFALMGWTKEPVMINKSTPKLDKNGKQVYKKVRTTAWHTKADVVIFDEVHRAQNGQSITSKTLLPGPGNDPGVQGTWKVGLSGTPTGNSFDGAWAVTRWLWPSVVDASIYVWRAKWAEVVYDPFAVRNQKVVGERDPGAFFSSLPCVVRIESDLKVEVDEQNIEVDLYPEQRRVYDQLEKMMVAWVEDHPLVTKFPITKRIRQRQATLGMPTLSHVLNKKTGEMDVEVGFDLECESSKIDAPNALWKILESPEHFDNETALIYTDSEQFAEVLTYRINKRYGEDTARKWSGRVPRKIRDQHKRDYIAGDFKYLVAVIASIGTGTDGLQVATRNLLYMSSSDDGISNEQSIGRALRRGQNADKVRIRRLIARGTIDQPQHESLTDAAIRRNKSLKRRK